MKNLIKASFLSLVILFGSANVKAAGPADPVKEAKVWSHIVTRVNEIENMDKSALSFSEKTALKKELRSMKKQAAGLDKRVYLSVGAIIIIILLLILIL